ncbi:MAG: hypothetical protein PHW69_02760 [Elusimicrobiaceae bacterium]|nr:hypothetical protein [Elusimicrobiaceae bacterium]
MKRVLTALCAAGFAIVAGGCMSKEVVVPPNQPAQRHFEASLDTTWRAVLLALSDSNIPIKNMQKNSGFLNTEFVLFKDVDEFAENAICQRDPSGWMSPYGSGRYTVSVVAAARDGGTDLRLTTYIEASNDVSGTREVCASRGEVERRLFARIQAGLADPAPAAEPAALSGAK